jgi:hypothetical protein
VSAADESKRAGSRRTNETQSSVMPHHEQLCVRVEGGRFVLESRDKILKDWYDRLAAAIPPSIC